MKTLPTAAIFCSGDFFRGPIWRNIQPSGENGRIGNYNFCNVTTRESSFQSSNKEERGGR
jgi:hypothetical protein